MFITGTGFTVMETEPDAVQLAVLPATTVNKVLVVGLNEKEANVLPLFHEYVAAPDAVIVELCPAQTDIEVGEIVS